MPDAMLSFTAGSGNVRSLSAASEAEFLRGIRWERRADAALKRAASDGDAAAFARRLRKRRLAGSGNPAARGKKREWPALWSLPAFSLDVPMRELVEALRGLDRPRRVRRHIGAKRRAGGNGAADASTSRESTVAGWIAAAPERGWDDPFELLCLFDALALAGRELPSADLWATWRRAAAGSAALLSALDAESGCAAAPDLRLLVAGELRWKAGLLFEGVHGARDLRDRGRETLGAALLEGTDTDGIPNAELIDRLALWLAPLVRSAEWGRRFDSPLWNDEQAERFRDLVGTVAPLCRADGRLALANGSAIDAVPLLMAATRLAGWKKKSRPHDLLTAVEKASRKRKPVAETNGRQRAAAKKPPVAQSDWARLACLRSDWSPAADALVLAHHRPAPLLELTARGVPLLQGEWEISASFDGRAIALADEWDCSCWHSDPDADFIELQMELDGGLRIERQALLSRDDHWLLLADSVAGAGDARIDYAARIPLAADVAGRGERETRACRLAAGSAAARAFPLALPQDRAHGTAGAFEAVEGGLALRLSAIGGLFAPLLIDWSPRRRNSRVDWRTLTVTENGRVLRAAEAAGHRIRLGNQQLLVYHSLRKGSWTRAVLGHHTAQETVIGRFDSDGAVDPILLVE
ncbi:MAG: hypothetical protein WD069_02145 [Planctomycetales bacterium]